MLKVTAAIIKDIGALKLEQHKPTRDLCSSQTNRKTEELKQVFYRKTTGCCFTVKVRSILHT